MSSEDSIFLLLSQRTCKERHESMTNATLGIVTEDSAIFVANITCNSKNFQKTDKTMPEGLINFEATDSGIVINMKIRRTAEEQK